MKCYGRCVGCTKNVAFYNICEVPVSKFGNLDIIPDFWRYFGDYFWIISVLFKTIRWTIGVLFHIIVQCYAN